jgi:hypothetical protein
MCDHSQTPQSPTTAHSKTNQPVRYVSFLISFAFLEFGLPLDAMVPVGFKRSRALWDEARRPHATRTETVIAYLAAIAYELQPIRLSESNKQQVIDGFKKFLQNLVHVVQGLPSVAKTVFSFVTTRSFREWLVAGGVLVYYFFVRWVHGYVLC